MLEMVNRLCEQAGEITKAQIIIDQKDRQIKELQQRIDQLMQRLQQPAPPQPE